MKRLIEKIKLKSKKIKAEYLLIAIASLIVIGLFASSFKSETQSNYSQIDDYVLNLEEKLSTRLSQVSGAGKVTVLISIKQGITTEIATEKKVTNNEEGLVSEEKPILVSGKPIVITEIYPEISGVVIIAKGADDLKVKNALLRATQTFLGITSDKIEILTMG